MAEMAYKKCTRKTKERQFLLIQKGKFSKFSSWHQPVAPQGDTKLNKLLAQKKDPGYDTVISKAFLKDLIDRFQNFTTKICHLKFN